MDKAAKGNMVTTYDYECGDHTKGTAQSREPEEARREARTACQDRQGVMTGPEARPWPGHQQ